MRNMTFFLLTLLFQSPIGSVIKSNLLDISGDKKGCQ